METLTRLVTDSLARHGFDRPVDPRRLQWSRWFRCDSTHSLLVVPSKPGIFAIAEEVMDLGPTNTHVGTTAPDAGNAHVATAARGCPERSSEVVSGGATFEGSTVREGHDFSRAVTPLRNTPASAAEGTPDADNRNAPVRRMLAVLQFSEDDDMAFTLDRMFTRINPMRARLASGRCFLRFVTIEDQDQRRSICSALNQWVLSSAEKATGIPAAFSSSVEISTDGERSEVGAGHSRAGNLPANIARDSGANKNLHCPQPLPSGF
ncbi:MAG: hypothetical protein WBM24_24845 [Candidatus Sulfotelmatobacter sp.]